MRRFAVLLLFAILQFRPALGLDCTDLKPTPPQNTDISLSGKMDGMIDGVFAKLVGAKGNIDGNYRRVATSVLQHFPNGETTYIWERVLFLQCRLLSEATDISSTEKFNMISGLYSKFSKAPPPLDPPTSSTTNSFTNSGNGVNSIQGNGNTLSTGGGAR
jgi:hypothetical protein